MKKFYYLVLSILLLSCGASEKSEGQIKEYITDSEPLQDSSVADKDSSLRADLSNYFSLEIVNTLVERKNNFDTLKTDKELEELYAQFRKLLDEMYEDIYTLPTAYLKEKAGDNEYWSPVEILDELQQFNGKLGPIEFSCAAECTDLSFYFDLEKWTEKAIQTSGDADNNFFNLLIAVEGSYGYAGYPGFKEWETQTWDLGGNSNIGNDTLLHCIQQYQSFEKKHADFFNSELTLIKNDFLNSLQYGYIYSFSQEKVLKEYDAILKLNFFNEKETEAIKKHYNEIQEGAEPFQFNCETGDCSYG